MKIIFFNLLFFTYVHLMGCSELSREPNCVQKNCCEALAQPLFMFYKHEYELSDLSIALKTATDSLDFEMFPKSVNHTNLKQKLDGNCQLLVQQIYARLIENPRFFDFKVQICYKKTGFQIYHALICISPKRTEDFFDVVVYDALIRKTYLFSPKIHKETIRSICPRGLIGQLNAPSANISEILANSIDNNLTEPELQTPRILSSLDNPYIYTVIDSRIFPESGLFGYLIAAKSSKSMIVLNGRINTTYFRVAVYRLGENYPNSIINIETGNDSYTYLRAAALNNGGYVVIYCGYSGSNGQKISIIILDSIGNITKRINPLDSDCVAGGNVAVFDDGNFMVAWVFSDNHTLYGSIFDGDGNEINHNFLIYYSEESPQTYPRMIAHEDGIFFALEETKSNGTRFLFTFSVKENLTISDFATVDCNNIKNLFSEIGELQSGFVISWINDSYFYNYKMYSYSLEVKSPTLPLGNSETEYYSIGNFFNIFVPLFEDNFLSVRIIQTVYGKTLYVNYFGAEPKILPIGVGFDQVFDALFDSSTCQLNIFEYKDNYFSMRTLGFPPLLVNNSIMINENNSTILSPDQIGVLGKELFNFEVIYSQHFNHENISNPGVPIYSFTSDQLNAGEIIVFHDGLYNIPYASYQIKNIYDRSLTYNATINVIFNQDMIYPFITNSFKIKDTQNITILPSMINSIGAFIDEQYFVENLSGGIFMVNKTISNTFTQAQINDSLVEFSCNDYWPSYKLILLINGSLNFTSKSNIIFTPFPSITNNSLIIRQGDSLVLNTDQICISRGIDYEFIFWVNYISNIIFQMNSVEITSFTQSQLKSGNVSVVHDDSEVAPTISLYVTNGEDNIVVMFNITFFRKAYLQTPDYYVKQGKSCSLLPDMITVSGDPNLQLAIFITYIEHGFFSYASSPKQAINTFTQIEINQSKILFTHDGSNFETVFNIYATDGISNTSEFTKTWGLINLPTVIANKFDIKQGSFNLVTSSNIDGFVWEEFYMIFYVKDTKYCYFQRKQNPGVAIQSFSKLEIEEEAIFFVHDGSYNIPSYTLIVSDGSDNASSKANITLKTLPILENNELIILQGENNVLNDSMLKAVDMTTKKTSPDIVFTAYRISNGYFFNNATNKKVTEFKQDDISNLRIIFVHDDSNNKPNIEISISFQEMETKYGSLKIIFKLSLNLLKNLFIIKSGGSLIISSDNLDVESTTPPNLVIFRIKKPKNCQFKMISNHRAITSFSLLQIYNSEIELVHDGSSIMPSFKFYVSDNKKKTSLVAALITFNGEKFPNVISNQIPLTEDEFIVLSVDNLDASDGTDNLVYFIITNSYQCHFVDKKTGLNISTFDTEKISQGLIRLVHNGGRIKPSFDFTLLSSDGTKSNSDYTANIIFNLKPIIIKKEMIISKGQKLLISSDSLLAYDEDSDNRNLMFFVSNVLFGRFESIDNPGKQINSFSQMQINSYKIYFIHDNSLSPPSFEVTVDDGIISLPYTSASISFIIKKGYSGLNIMNTINKITLDSLAYTSDGTYLITSCQNGIIEVYSLYDQGQPEVISNLDLEKFGISNIGRILVNESYVLAISQDNTMVVISIENINNLTFLGKVGSSNSTVKDLIINNDYAYLAAGIKGLIIVSNANPLNPEIHSILDMGCSVSSLKKKGNYLFIVCEDNSIMKIFDISNNEEPLLVSSLDITAFGHHIVLSYDSKFAFIALNSGYVVLDLLYPDNPQILKIFPIEELFYIGFPTFPSNSSKDNNKLYITCISDHFLYVINSDDPSNPTITQKVDLNFELNELVPSPDSTKLYVSSMQGLIILSVVQAISSRISPLLNITNIQKITPLDSPIDIVITDSGNYYIVSDKKSGIAVYDANQFLLINAFDLGPCYMISLSQKTSTAYLANDESFLILNINSPENYSMIGKASCNGSVFGVTITSSEDYAYITKPESKQLYVISIMFPSLPSIVGNLSGFISEPTMVTKSNNDKTLYIICREKGFAIVDISEKEKPKFIIQNNVGNISSIIFFQNNNIDYLAVSLYSLGSLMIYNVSSPANPILISSIYLGNSCSGLALLKSKNHIFVQTEKSLTTVEIMNASNPVIVNKESLGGVSIKPTMRMAVSDYYLTFPTLEKIKLYDEEVAIYGNLDVQNLNDNKIFIISFYQVDPISLNQPSKNVSFIDFKLFVVWPYWITVDYINNKLIITAPSKDSLEVLRRVKVTYATSINATEFEDISPPKTANEVFRELILLGIINIKGMILPGYDPDFPLPLDSGFDSDKIQKIVNKHYFIKVLTFTIDDFLRLDRSPVVSYERVQDQFDAKIKPTINTPIDFQFNEESAFDDPDGDKLTFSVENLPSWLNFYQQGKRFLGTPTQNDLGDYSITIIASDGYKTTSDKLVFSVTNQPPESISPGDQNLTLGKTLSFYLPATTFVDPESDPMTYEANLIENDTLQILPSWMSFDDSRLLLYGAPSKEDVAFDAKMKRYFSEFIINITATDVAHQPSSIIFKINVINSAPKLNKDLTLSSQFNSLMLSKHPDRSYVKINEVIDFQFSLNTFQDDDLDLLVYSVDGLPSFLSFTANRLYGSPRKEHLGSYYIKIICSDSFSQVSDKFHLSVINHPPYLVQNISDVTFNLGQQFNLFISSNTFNDSDGDNLIYEVNEVFKNGSIHKLPEWLEFDSSRNLLTGNPTSKFVYYNETEHRYYQSFNICVKAIDSGEESASTYFLLTIQNTAPKSNPNKTLQSQIQNKYPSVETFFEFTIDPFTFFDDNNVSLSYEARLVKQKNSNLPQAQTQRRRRMLEETQNSSTQNSSTQNLSTQNLSAENVSTQNLSTESLSTQNLSENISYETSELPNWINFDSQTKKFSINPPKDTVFSEYTILVTADNGFQKEAQEFSFVVQITSTFILNYLLKFIGPLITLLGLIKYRAIIYALFFKKKYDYRSADMVGINEYYEKRIFLIGKDLEIASKIWKLLKKEKKMVLNRLILKEPLEFRNALENAIQEELKLELEKKSNSKNIYYLKSIHCQQVLMILEVFSTLETIQKDHPKTLELFYMLMKKYEKENKKNWYANFLKPVFNENNMDCFSNEFCSFEFDEERLNEEIEKIKANDKIYSNSKVYPEDSAISEKDILKKLISFHALGIPEKPLKWYEILKYSQGESILKHWTDIAYLQYDHIDPFNSEKNDDSLWDFPICRFNSHIPPWLNCQVINNILVFSGSPTKADKGKFVITMFDQNGIVYRQFSIKVIEKENNGQNDNSPTMTALPFSGLFPTQKNFNFKNKNSKEYTEANVIAKGLVNTYQKLNKNNTEEIESPQMENPRKLLIARHENNKNSESEFFQITEPNKLLTSFHDIANEEEKKEIEIFDLESPNKIFEDKNSGLPHFERNDLPPLFIEQSPTSIKKSALIIDEDKNIG